VLHGADRRRAGGHRLRLGAVLVGLDVSAAGLTLWAVTPRSTELATAALGVAAGATTFYLLNRAHALYRSYVSASRVLAYAALLRCALIASGAAHLALLARGVEQSLVATAAGGIGMFGITAVGRYAFDRWLAGRRAAGALRRAVVAIGTPEEVGSLVRLFAARPTLGVDVVAAVGPHTDDELAGFGVPWLGQVTDAAYVVRQVGASGAVLGAGGVRPEEVRAVVRGLEDIGAHVYVASGLRGIDYRRIRTVGLAHEPFLYLGPPSFSAPQLVAKRLLDIALGSVLLVAALPVLLVAGAAVRAADGGPVLFRQIRVGRDGRPITILKLRTMVPDAEKRLDGLRASNERTGGPLFKMTDDPRVTPIGRFLRTSSIDELPQLLQVVRGQMSLVGPRPALPEEVAAFDPELLQRLRTKPGLTGLWQIEAREEPDFAAYRQLDLFYVENWSLLLDLFVICDTVPTLVGRAVKAVRGAVPPPTSGPAAAPMPAAETSGAPR
jgi:exopolysaccharide biosynthesis polyprenyl glycosylphosphotransferase